MAAFVLAAAWTAGFIVHPSTTQASFPGQNGKIAFVGNGDPASSGTPSTDIFSMNSDGSNRVRLTNTAGVRDDMPAWSADGRSIVWMSFGGEGPGFGDIMAMRHDGTGKRTVLAARSNTIFSDPSWSPDGTHIVFSMTQGGYTWLRTMRSNGTGERSITSENGYNIDPSWSPDGKLIAFIRDVDVWVTRTDGSGARRVAGADEFAHSIEWAPDGKRIYFLDGTGCDREVAIRVTDLKGNVSTRPPNGLSEFGLSPSPDGKRLAISTIRPRDCEVARLQLPAGAAAQAPDDLCATQQRAFCIAVGKSDGSDFVKVPGAPGDTFPAWQPIPTKSLTPVLTLAPPLGPPGFAPVAKGTGFPPNKTFTLRWQPGLGTTSVRTDDKGTFTRTVLVFTRDGFFGPRVLLVVELPAVKPAPFLLVPASLQPSRFTLRR